MTSLRCDRRTQRYQHSPSEGAQQPCRPQTPPARFAGSASTSLISLFAPGFFFPPLKLCLCSNITNGSMRNVIFSVWLFGTVHLRFIHYYMFCYFVPFLLLSSVLLNGFTSLLVGLPFSQLRDIWIIYSFGWLWIKLPNIFAHRLLCEHRLSFHLGK